MLAAILVCGIGVFVWCRIQRKLWLVISGFRLCHAVVVISNFRQQQQNP